MDDTGILVSSGAVGAICGVVGIWIKGIFAQKRSIENPVKAQIDPQPLSVENSPKGPFVTVGECKQHRCALDKRIDLISTGNQRIIDKLDEIDQRSEERAIALNRRLDPIVETTAANKAQIEMLKDAARQATIGGAK